MPLESSTCVMSSLAYFQRVHQGLKPIPKEASYLGMAEHLPTAVKITRSEVVCKCFDWENQPFSYPKLPSRTYLIACVHEYLQVKIYGVYTLVQMQQMLAQREAPGVKHLDWCALEIPEDLEAQLSEVRWT